MRFVLFIISMLLLAGCGNSIDVTDLQEGDVVFIESQSSQSPYIKVVYPSQLGEAYNCNILHVASQSPSVT